MNKEWITDGTGLGGLPIYGIVTILFFVTGYELRSYQLASGFIIFYCSTMLIRYFYFKKRPKEELYTTTVQKLDASSFPSLHASRVTTLTLITASFYENTAVTILLIISAAAICWTRIVLRRHDIIDVSGGIILGMLTTGIVLYILTPVLQLLPVS
ncbi:phosphatase PAP2 family protein [Candidatus Woesearchaeota archaeon]|nr:phosphatase PAP2 family protein [Candidatus Woesearchaeota archaeon]